MKITRNTITGKRPLSELKQGQVFEFHRRIYMKTSLEGPKDIMHIALNNGDIIEISKEVMVRVMRANLKVSY